MSNTKTNRKASTTTRRKPAKRKTTSKRRASRKKASVKEQLTAVRTGYARACILLLAVNLLLTGYCISKLSPKEEKVAETEQRQEQVSTEQENGS